MAATTFAVASFLIGAASAAKSYSDSKKAAKAQKASGQVAKDIANENAARIKSETAESARRLKGQQAMNLSEAKARSAASGVRSTTGSQGQFVEGLGSSFASELAWLKKSGASKAQIEARSGDYAVAQAKAGAAGTMAAGVGQAGSLLGSGASSAANWWALRP